MIYLDTSLVVSYVDLKDPNHERAERVLRDAGSEKRVVSMLVLVELASVYSRAGLENPLVLALYSLDLVGAEVLEVDYDEALKRAFKVAPVLKMRTLDLLHIAACSVMGARRFATLDREVISKASLILEALGIEVVA